MPVNFSSDIFDALDIQDELQTLYTSGTVFHAFLGQKLNSWKEAATLVRKIAENYRLPYYTLSPTYSICQQHGYISGEASTCPICGKPTEIYSRITGYYRPVQNWNKGKTQEFKERVVYDIATSVLKKEAPVGGEKEESGIASVTLEAPILFTRKTCPNCKMAKIKLDKAGIAYTIVDAEEEVDKTRAFGISKAPTLVVPTDSGFALYENASNITRYIEENK